MTAQRWANQDTYAALIEAAADANGVSHPVAYGLIAQESSFNPTAIRQEPTYYCAATGVTGDASFGLMQLLYCTAQGLGFSGPSTGLFDPATNLAYGMQLLGALISKHGGDVDGALSEYNGGDRPTLGYGTRRADGTFANQSYVDNIDSNAAYFAEYLAARDGTAPTDSSGAAIDSGTDDGMSAGSLAGAVVIGGVIWYAIARLLRH